MITLENVKDNERIDTIFRKTNVYLGAQGVIDHDYSHAEAVAKNSQRILEELGYPKRDGELAAIAGYLHDIGNVINRFDHGRTGGVLVFTLLEDMGMDPEEIAIVVSAIGNHEEKTGSAISNVCAAVIISDKSDVKRERVRKADFTSFTTRDRVNYAVEQSEVKVIAEQKAIELRLKIDLEISSVMEYFEIFLTRMLLCRRSCSLLNCNFELYINENRFL